MFKNSSALVLIVGLGLGLAGCGKESVTSGSSISESPINKPPFVNATFEGTWFSQPQASGENGQLSAFEPYTRQAFEISGNTIRFSMTMGQHFEPRTVDVATYTRLSADRILVRRQNGTTAEATYTINGQNIQLCWVGVFPVRCLQANRAPDSERLGCAGSIPRPNARFYIRGQVDGRWFEEWRHVAEIFPDHCSRLSFPVTVFTFPVGWESRVLFSGMVQAILVENDPTRTSAYRMNVQVMGQRLEDLRPQVLNDPKMIWTPDQTYRFSSIQYGGSTLELELAILPLLNQ
jgi:hypothetical protein